MTGGISLQPPHHPQTVLTYGPNREILPTNASLTRGVSYPLNRFTFFLSKLVNDAHGTTWKQCSGRAYATSICFSSKYLRTDTGPKRLRFQAFQTPHEAVSFANLEWRKREIPRNQCTSAYNALQAPVLALKSTICSELRLFAVASTNMLRKFQKVCSRLIYQVHRCCQLRKRGTCFLFVFVITDYNPVGKSFNEILSNNTALSVKRG